MRARHASTPSYAAADQVDLAELRVDLQQQIVPIGLLDLRPQGTAADSFAAISSAANISRRARSSSPGSTRLHHSPIDPGKRRRAGGARPPLREWDRSAAGHLDGELLGDHPCHRVLDVGALRLTGDGVGACRPPSRLAEPTFAPMVLVTDKGIAVDRHTQRLDRRRVRVGHHDGQACLAIDRAAGRR